MNAPVSGALLLLLLLVVVVVVLSNSCILSLTWTNQFSNVFVTNHYHHDHHDHHHYHHYHHHSLMILYQDLTRPNCTDLREVSSQLTLTRTVPPLQKLLSPMTGLRVYGHLTARNSTSKLSWCSSWTDNTIVVISAIIWPTYLYNIQNKQISILYMS